MEELLFYGEITNFTVSSFILRMKELETRRVGADILTNSMGGDSDAGFGIIKTVRDFPFPKKMTVHGAAYSMMAFAALFMEKVEAIEQSQFLFHRAAALFEESDTMKRLLEERNADLRKAIEEKLDVAKFESISGVSLDQMFDMNQRVDVIFNSSQAREIGLVTKVIPLSSGSRRTIEANILQIAAKGDKFIKTLKTSSIMTLEELKEKDPEAYKAMKAQAEKDAQAKLESEAKAKEEEAAKKKAKEEKSEEGVIDKKSMMEEIKAEMAEEHKTLVEEWSVYADVDPAKVQAGILSGKLPTLEEKKAFMEAASKKTFGKNLQSNGKTVQTKETQEGEVSEATENLRGMEKLARMSVGLKEEKEDDALVSRKDAIDA